MKFIIYAVVSATSDKKSLHADSLARSCPHAGVLETLRRSPSLPKVLACSSSLSNTVDGSCDHGEITNIISSNIKSILNFSSDLHYCSNLYNRMNKSISSSDLSSMIITQETVPFHNCMKTGKHDGSSFMSNHFIYAKVGLSDPLSKLFMVMLRHGAIPDSFREHWLYFSSNS